MSAFCIKNNYESRQSSRFIYEIIMKVGKALFFSKTTEGEDFFRRDVDRRPNVTFFEKNRPPSVPCVISVCVLHTRPPKEKKIRGEENKVVMVSAH